jgi:hypothetical protein
MPGQFLDTSALAKHYHLEPGSAEVDRLWADLNNSLYISRLGVVAVALDLQGRGMIDLLVSSDQHLLTVARAEGLSVFDPENP